MRTRSWVAVAAVVYVLAWVIGLASAPSAPSPSAADAEVQRFYAQHHGSTLVQAVFVHGVAGVAFAVFVVSLGRKLALFGDDAARRWFLGAGLAAAAVSLVQLGLEIALDLHVHASDDAGTTAALFHAVNIADTVKLVLLGIAVAAATRIAADAGLFGKWLQRVGYALLPLLVIGALAFVVDQDFLTAVLDLSLVLLLLWVGTAGVIAARSRAPALGAA